MKKSIQFLTLILCMCTFSNLSAQMAFNHPSAFLLGADINRIDVQVEDTYGLTVFDYEATKDYLPFTEPLFSRESGDEDISNFLPFATPIFGTEEVTLYLPVDDNKGYFIENTSSTEQSEFIVFSDNNFNEIIISLESISNREIDITILNAYGKKMVEQNTTTTRGFNDISVQVDNLTGGLYSMVIKSDKESLRKKFIIK